MRVTERQLRRIIRETIEETYGESDETLTLDQQQMRRILGYLPPPESLRPHIVRYHLIDRDGNLDARGVRSSRRGDGQHESIVDAPDVESAQKLFKKTVLIPKGARLRIDSIEEQ